MEISSRMLLGILPLILINIALVVWCLTDWLKRKNFRYFPKSVWLLIFLFIQLIGPIAYLLYGKQDDGNTL